MEYDWDKKLPLTGLQYFAPKFYILYITYININQILHSILIPCWCLDFEKVEINNIVEHDYSIQYSLLLMTQLIGYDVHNLQLWGNFIICKCTHHTRTAMLLILKMKLILNVMTSIWNVNNNFSIWN